jgi:hypothetical protein
VGGRGRRACGDRVALWICGQQASEGQDVVKNGGRTLAVPVFVSSDEIKEIWGRRFLMLVHASRGACGMGKPVGGGRRANQVSHKACLATSLGLEVAIAQI